MFYFVFLSNSEQMFPHRKIESSKSTIGYKEGYSLDYNLYGRFHYLRNLNATIPVIHVCK